MQACVRSTSTQRPIALLHLLVALLTPGTMLFGQTSQAPSEEERIAEMKARVVALLSLNRGATAADVGCGEGFYTIPLAHSLGPSGRVYAEDISEGALVKLKQNLAEEALRNVEVIKGTVEDPKLPKAVLHGALIVNAYTKWRLMRSC